MHSKFNKKLTTEIPYPSSELFNNCQYLRMVKYWPIYRTITILKLTLKWCLGSTYQTCRHWLFTNLYKVTFYRHISNIKQLNLRNHVCMYMYDVWIFIIRCAEAVIIHNYLFWDVTSYSVLQCFLLNAKSIVLFWVIVLSKACTNVASVEHCCVIFNPISWEYVTILRVGDFVWNCTVWFIWKHTIF